MNSELHPDVADMMNRYRRDLAQISPSDSLDERIARLATSPATKLTREPAPGRRRPWLWATAAAFAVLAIGVGVLIGMRVERSGHGDLAQGLVSGAADALWSPGDLGMWPSESVALTIPAEYSPQGTLVAVTPDSPGTGRRYWIDVVVSNDGTIRIQRIVPADEPSHPAEKHGPFVQ